MIPRFRIAFAPKPSGENIAAAVTGTSSTRNDRIFPDAKRERPCPAFRGRAAIRIRREDQEGQRHQAHDNARGQHVGPEHRVQKGGDAAR